MIMPHDKKYNHRGRKIKKKPKKQKPAPKPVPKPYRKA